MFVIWIGERLWIYMFMAMQNNVPQYLHSIIYDCTCINHSKSWTLHWFKFDYSLLMCTCVQWTINTAAIQTVNFTNATSGFLYFYIGLVIQNLLNIPISLRCVDLLTEWLWCLKDKRLCKIHMKFLIYNKKWYF